MAYEFVGFQETPTANVVHMKTEHFPDSSKYYDDHTQKNDVSNTPSQYIVMSHLNNLYQLQYPPQPTGNSMLTGTLQEAHQTPVDRSHTEALVKKEASSLQKDQGKLINDVASLSQKSPEKKTNTQNKPDISYFAMVAKAIQQSERGYVILNDIYMFVLKNYPYYENAPLSWKISIRHQLSTNSCFVKVASIPGQRGFYWAIHPACKEELAKGSYRTALQKVRNTARRYMRGKRAGDRMQRYIGNLSKTSANSLNKLSHKAPDYSKPNVPDGYALMQTAPLQQNHPFYFLSQPEFPYESYVAKHNKQSWNQEVNLVNQDTCACETQQQVLSELRGAGTSRIFTEFAQNHVMPCSSGFDDFM